MTTDHGEVVVRDLGSTNGIRINGQRVELGRLRPGDELSIAHIRYRLDNGQGHEPTLADGVREADPDSDRSPAEAAGLAVAASSPVGSGFNAVGNAPALGLSGEQRRVAAAARDALARAGLGDRYRIQVIVQPEEGSPGTAAAKPVPAENLDACRPDSSP
jgi:hypothetical protein